MADFLLNLGTLFLALVVFGITVFVHEFGHFIAARRCGLVVKTFSIGFGKAVFQRERNGIVYKIGWIPFGGYVALPQLDPAGMERIQGDSSSGRLPDVSPWKKIAVAAAGPLGNVLLAVVLAVLIWLIPGGEAASQFRPVIGTIETNSLAYAAGLRAGDEIRTVNGTAVRNWIDFTVEAFLKKGDTVALTVFNQGTERALNVPVVRKEAGEPVMEGVEAAIPCLFGAVTKGGPADRAGVRSGDIALTFGGVPVLGWDHFTELIQAAAPDTATELTVERKGKTVSLSIIPEFNAEYDRIMVGVQFGGLSLPWMLYKNPLDQLKYDALAIARVLKALVTPSEAKQAAGGLGGPILIFSVLMMSIKTSLLNTFGLIRFLNINLAVLNLLPVPVLDGGHILFSLWHGITRRKVSVRIQTALINFFAVLLIGAMLLVTFNDAERSWGIKKFFVEKFSMSAEEE